jgi:hypothetical protein
MVYLSDKTVSYSCTNAHSTGPRVGVSHQNDRELYYKTYVNGVMLLANGIVTGSHLKPSKTA